MYSQVPLLLSTPATLLAGDRVFAGNQPDDFAAGGLLTEVNRACVLGLGYGGSIRPIAVTAPGADIVAVEIDEAIARVCTGLFESYFSDVRFRVQLADARTALDHSSDYDLICVDLYACEVYPRFLFEPDFWWRVRESLAPGGVVLINSWGLPGHLAPLQPPSPQSALADVLADVWPAGGRYLPYRRNMTVVLGNDRPPGPADREPERRLELEQRLENEVDQAVLELLPLRLEIAPPWPGASAERRPQAGAEADRFPATSDELDAEMHRRWPALLKALADSAQALGIDPAATRGRRFVTDPQVAIPVTLRLLELGDPAAEFVPVAAAALAFEQVTEVGWFPEWIAQEADVLAELSRDWLISIAMPQALSMLANPLAPPPPGRSGLLDAVHRVAKEARPRTGSLWLT